VCWRVCGWWLRGLHFILMDCAYNKPRNPNSVCPIISLSIPPRCTSDPIILVRSRRIRTYLGKGSDARGVEDPRCLRYSSGRLESLPGCWVVMVMVVAHGPAEAVGSAPAGIAGMHSRKGLVGLVGVMRYV
jgi:hypothetical protein